MVFRIHFFDFESDVPKLNINVPVIQSFHGIFEKNRYLKVL